MNIPTQLLCQVQVKPPGVEFLGTISKFRTRNKILLLLAYFLHKSHKIQQIHIVVMQKLQNVQKSVLQVQSSCFAYVLVADSVVGS